MTQCDLCNTQQAHSYGKVYGIGMVCHRCSLLTMGGPEMASMPHCPAAPPDTDPDVLAAYQKGTEPLSLAEFDKWVEKSRRDAPSPFKGKERVQQDMTGRKLEDWFSNQKDGAALLETPIKQEKLRFADFERIVNSIPCPMDIKNQKQEGYWREDINRVKMLLFDLKEDTTLECGACGRWAASMTCSRCHQQKYCSRTCQRSDWKEHKKTCQTEQEIIS